MAFETSSPDSSRTDSVTSIRKDLYERFEEYDLIEDCLAGGKAVKKRKEKYLPIPDATNPDTTARDARYEAYITRAVFYNVTQRTALGLIGEIFSRDPEVKVPASLEDVVTDSSGGGISLEQLARQGCWYALGYGRGGLFVDYPPSDGPTSKAEQKAGNVRATISMYDAKSVINWRVKKRNSKLVLSLTVLKEEYTIEDDGFQTKTGIQYRELRLGPGDVYYVQLWRPKDVENISGGYEPYGAPYYPKDGRGNPLTDIPFTFFGSRDNEPSIDPPPLYDMADINIAHYRNSADFEETVFVVGQPTLCVTGLTKEWYEGVLNKVIPFGSRAGLPLPKDADAKILQVEETAMAKEAMEHKEKQMVALGAKIVENRDVQRTATEAKGDKATEQSVLGAVAKNVSSAIKWALEWCAVFHNTAEAGIEFKLNTDFELAKLSAEDREAVVKNWLDGALSWTEMRSVMRKAGIASMDDEKAKAEIEKDKTAEIEKAAKQLGMETKAVTDNSPPPAAA